jgi:tyrosyl-tRNA synthetase
MSASTNPDLDRLLRRTETVQPPDELARRIAEGRPLRVKLGLDPTAPAVTLGWAVVLRKLRDFQEQGHTAVLIVGDFTAQVGDPSQRSETRKRLSAEEVRGYAAAVLSQFETVLLPEPLEVRYNSEWLAGLNMSDVLELTATATVAQLLERGDFAKRFAAGTPISVLEFMYPFLQGYDSVAVEADIELGGSDQLWNLMMGRVIQQRYGQSPQIAMTMPLLIGTDGEQKMSQSLGNYIGVSDPPEEMFGKVMSIPDRLIVPWFRLVTEIDPGEIAEIEQGLATTSLHPGETKRRLAREIVDLYWGTGSGKAAEAAFDRLFREHLPPDEIPEYRLPPGQLIYVPSLLRDSGLVGSASEGRRLLEQRAVKLDGEPLSGLEMERTALADRVLQVGKRRFLRLTGG